MNQKADRIPLRYPLQLLFKGGRRMLVRSLDVSASGILVESVFRVSVGSVVRIRAKHVPIFYGDAYVRQCVRKGLVYRIGLEFEVPLNSRF